VLLRFDIQESRDVLLTRIKWLMSLRLMLATFSLGTAALVQISAGKTYLDSYLLSLYLLIGIVYCLSLGYAYILRQIVKLDTFAFIQLFLDVLLISGLVKVTGGAASDFILFYYLSIIAAGIILYRKGSIILASAASILYFLIIGLEYYDIVNTVSAGKSQDVAPLLFSVIMRITAFYLVAFLSGFLSEQVRQSRAALRLKESDYHRLETLHKNIIESINSGLLTIDREMNITFFNRAAEVLTGYAFSEVQGRMIGEVFPGLLQAAAGADANGSGDEVPRARFEISFRRNDGRQVYLGFSKSTLKDGDREQQGEVYAFQDVTRLKEMEEQVKIMDRLAAVGRLASGMAHEIRNPLASMSGSIQILGQSLQLDDDNKRLMDIVLKETNRLDQLLSDFVLFTHPDQRKKKQIELNTVIMDTIELFLSNPDHNMITVMTDLNGSILLEADPHQIKQVLWNLFVNAHQAMSQGGNLTITSKKVAASDLTELRQKLPVGAEVPCWVQLTVADTGCGIEVSDVDKVFDPFFTTKPRGSGLGLAIVYSIIESYKGQVSLKSQQDRGTTFTILLPAV
jgi:two-component system sensor histidine kinase PilS (NtrC family)